MNFEWLTNLWTLGTSMHETIAAAPPLLLYFTALSLPILAWFIVRIYRNIARNVEAIFRIAAYWMSHTLASVKTRIICKLRELMPRRRTSDIESTAGVEFDDVDLAVLRAAAAMGPGIAINAAELAKKFRLKPAQVQRSLNKLIRNKMLDFVIGSGEGIDNYRLTQMGTAFMSTWNRQAGQQA